METVVSVASLLGPTFTQRINKSKEKNKKQLDSQKEQGRGDGGLEHNTGSICKAIANPIC